MNDLCVLYKKFFAVFIVILTLLFVCPLLFGYVSYAIETKSMEPTIPTGAIVYVKKNSLQALKLNDIVTFEKSNVLVTHRIVGIDEKNGQLTTKGDGVIYNDEEKISISSVKGIVKYSIPLIGYVLMFFKSIEGIILSIIFIILDVISIFLPRIKEG